MFVVPVFYSMWQEGKVKRASPDPSIGEEPEEDLLISKTKKVMKFKYHIKIRSDSSGKIFFLQYDPLNPPKGDKFLPFGEVRRGQNKCHLSDSTHKEKRSFITINKFLKLSGLLLLFALLSFSVSAQEDLNNT